MEVRIRTSGVLAAVLGAAFLCPCACRAADAPKPPAAGAGEAGLAASAAPTGAARDWPHMLGPGRSGVVECAGLAPQFADGKPPVVWQANVGFGSAPVVVAGGRVYGFGLFKPAAAPAGIAGPQSAPVLDDVAKGTFACGDLPGTPDRVKKSDYPQAFRGDLYALCLDASTGKQVWTSRLTDSGVAFKTTTHSSTAWELASPLLADGKLYIHTHSGRLYCLDAAGGKLEWEVNLFEHRMSTWYGGQQGNSCAPLKVGGHVIVSYEGEKNCLAVAAFDAATGAERWVATAPMGGLNVRTARLGFATLGNQPTVLCSCGGGTMGLDPETGRVLWSFDLIEANPDTMKQVPPQYASPERTVRDYKVDAMRSPFPGYAPLAWQDYVVDAACVGHNAVTSATWCLKVEGGQATRVWQTGELVPQSSSLKSHMVVRDGRLYGFDSYFPGFIRQYAVTRPYRGEKIGEFQCRDVVTGKLLWSSDAFNPAPPGSTRVDSTSNLFILAGDHVIVCNNSGLWIGQLLGDGVKILAHVPQAGRMGRMLSEPLLVDGRLFVRQLDADPKAGLLPALGGGGNLTCLDLRARQ